MVKKILDWVEKILSWIVIILLTAMTMVIFYQVILRYVFHSANIWAEEFARYAFIWVTMFGAAICIRRYRHIRIDVFVNILPEKMQCILELGMHAVVLIFLTVSTWYGITICMKTGAQISSGLRLPMSFMYSSIPVSSVIMIAFILERMGEGIGRGFMKKEKENRI